MQNKLIKLMAACYQSFEYSPTAAAERPPQPRERARPVVMNWGVYVRASEPEFTKAASRRGGRTSSAPTPTDEPRSSPTRRESREEPGADGSTLTCSGETLKEEV